MQGQHTILVVEDDPDDQMLITEAFTECKIEDKLYFVADGAEAIDFLKQREKYSAENAPVPDLIVLDLNLPKKDGRETLAEIKADKELHSIPVVVLTTSKAEEDIFKTYDLGVSGYIVKPMSFGRLKNIVEVLNKYWFSTVMLPVHKSVV